MRKALYEKRADLLEELQALLDKAKEEDNRPLTDEEKELFKQIENQIKGIDETAEAEAKAEDLKKEPDNSLKKDETEEEKDTRAFANYIREVRGTANLTSAANGAVIPKTIADKIIKRVLEISPIYRDATRYNVGGTISVPYYDESAGSITVAYATEFQALTSTSGKYSSIDLSGFLAGALTLVSKSLVNNSDFDIVALVVENMSQALAKWIEGECLNGTASKIKGIAGSVKDEMKITTASETAITADELISLQELVADDYQAKAYFIMNKSTRTAIRKLKDGQGNYLLNKDFEAPWGYTLLGKPVYTSENCKPIAKGNNAIFYGDMSGLAVKVSEDMNIEVLREKYADQHALGVIGWVEMDAQIENAQKISVLTVKTS